MYDFGVPPKKKVSKSNLNLLEIKVSGLDWMVKIQKMMKTTQG